MAIVKRKNKSGTVKYQVKVRDAVGKTITKTFSTQKDARRFETKLKNDKFEGNLIRTDGRKKTLDQFWLMWKEECRSRVSFGWQSSQDQMYKDYISPSIGHLRLEQISPISISRVLNSAKKLKRSDQTIRHIFNLLHKMFDDALCHFEYISRNPVLKKMKPAVIQKESRHLGRDEIVRLLQVSRNERFGLAVWIAIFCGLRVGEIQALKWDCVDLDDNEMLVKATYARKEKVIQDYPKGKKWFRVPIPAELKDFLAESQQINGKGYVVTSAKSKEMMSYDSYSKVLRKLCSKAGIENVGSHGLRHSTPLIYLESGATVDDVRALLGHSSANVTDRYIHDKKFRRGNLSGIAENILIFPVAQNSDCSQNVPIAHDAGLI